MFWRFERTHRFRFFPWYRCPPPGVGRPLVRSDVLAIISVVAVCWKVFEIIWNVMMSLSTFLSICVCSMQISAHKAATSKSLLHRVKHGSFDILYVVRQ